MRTIVRIVGGAGLVASVLGCAKPPSCPSRAQSAKSFAETLSIAITQYSARHDGELPSSLEILCADDPQNANRPYLEVAADELVDPWGSPYEYEMTGAGFRVFSLGADGIEGGRGADADIIAARSSH